MAPESEHTWTDIAAKVMTPPEAKILGGQCANCGVERDGKPGWFSCQDEAGRSCTRTQPHATLTKAVIARSIEQVEWVDVPTKTGDLPAMQGLGLRGLIAELKLPKVSAVAYGPLGAGPYDLLAVRAHYSNGTLELFAVDRGGDVIPVVTNFTATVPA